MRRLLHGVRHFHQRIFPIWRPRFEHLASGQSPSTLFITCSDSRIVPHLLTQTEPGELFVLRNAGNLVPPSSAAHAGEAATIEYAVEVLKVSDVVVCGHSHCGAIAGLLRPESLRHLPAVRNWLAHARSTFQEFNDHASEQDPQGDVLAAAVQHNVTTQLAHLRTYDHVEKAESRGDLALHGWFYRFETGETFRLDEQAQTFCSMLDAPAGNTAFT
jgi:carbonic anhydrase